MPFYCYICPECQNKVDVLKPMAESGASSFCAKDGAELNRDFSRELAGQSSMDYATPHVSDSLAMNPEQIPEHNRMFPEIKVLADGRPSFDSPKQQDKYLKATGFVKLHQKTKSKSSTRRIA